MNELELKNKFEKKGEGQANEIGENGDDVFIGEEAANFKIGGYTLLFTRWDLNVKHLMFGEKESIHKFECVHILCTICKSIVTGKYCENGGNSLFQYIPLILR
jgi:hypothetical protein